MRFGLGKAGPFGDGGDAGLLDELFPKSRREGIPAGAEDGLPALGFAAALDFLDQILGLRVGEPGDAEGEAVDRKSTRLNSSHVSESRMPSSA